MERSLHVYYSGMVQGVGFRFTAERLAASLNLKGWVKNLVDGRVEVLCEGEERKLKEFLQKIQSTFQRYIRDTDIEWNETSGKLAGFDIRFD